MNDDTRNQIESTDTPLEIPEVVPVLPLKDTVIYPMTAAPLAVGGGTGSPLNPLATF